VLGVGCCVTGLFYNLLFSHELHLSQLFRETHDHFPKELKIITGREQSGERASLIQMAGGRKHRPWRKNHFVIRSCCRDIALEFFILQTRLGKGLMNIIDKKMLTKFLQELVTLFFLKTALLKGIRSVLRPHTFAAGNNRNFLLSLNMAAI
jgi:hypothetical protein